MDFDLKQIGLAAKDIILGAGTAAAGTTGGPAAAEGVGKVGSGLDRILGMAGVTETRGDKFDRADFAARPKSPTPARNSTQASQPAEPPESDGGKATSDPDPSAARQQAPYTGDTKIAVDHLRSLGWPHDKVRQILSGPENTSLAAVVGKDTKGFRARGVEGTHIPRAEGTALPLAEGRRVATVEGQPVPSVRGAALKADNNSGSA